MTRALLQEALAESERSFVRRIAASWEQIASLFGYRVLPETGLTFEDVATMASADLRGHVVMALASPGTAARRFRGRPFGAGTEAEWSLQSLALGSIASAFLEPDPDVTWDDERVALLRRTIGSRRLSPA